MEQNGNSLKGSMVFNNICYDISLKNEPTTVESIEYVICGGVKFQVILNVFSTVNGYYLMQNIYIQVAKFLCTDSLKYTMLFSSKQLDVTSTITIDDPRPLKVLIKQISDKIERSFDIDVRLDISRSTEPFTSLYNDTELTDFELHGKDGCVRVHKLILANNSPVLKTMLSGKWKEVKAGAIEVPKISKETLQHLKDYMYLQKMPKDKVEVERLAELASYYMMSDLKQRCTFVMLSHLKLENIFQCLELAMKFDMKTLVMAIFDNFKRGVFKLEDMDHWCALEERAKQVQEQLD